MLSFGSIRCSMFFSFLKFSQTLSQIQQTSSTNQKVEILSSYIQTLSQQEKLGTKKLFDLVNQKIKTGLSDKLLITNCTKIFTGNTIDSDTNQDSENQTIQKNKETVSVVQKYIPTDKISLNIQVKEINQVIDNITKIQGKNSVQLKIKEIVDTLAKLSFIQSRFFLRILTKDMKIGMKNKLIEKAYLEANSQQQGPNLAFNFKSFNAMLARPLRDVEEFQKFCAKKTGKIVADVKYDGQRTLITFQKGKDIVLISRNGKQQNQKYYKIAQNLQKILESQLDLRSITLDGQIMAVDKSTQEPLPFQVLLTKRRKIDSILPQDESEDVQELVYIFDVLEYNGLKLYETPLIERKKLIFENHLIKKGEYEIFDYPYQKDKLMEYFHTITKRKYEGLILKGPEDHYYTNGTRIHWGKLKKGFRQKKEDKGQIDLDLILMGADYGRGKKTQLFSSFLMGVRQGSNIIPISRVGTGFTDDDLEELTQEFKAKIEKNIDSRYQIPKSIKMDVWFKPELVIEIDCQELTRSPLYELGFKEKYGGISLRFPVFKKLRDDKNIDQATDAGQVLQEMEKQEKKMMQRVVQRSDKKLETIKFQLSEDIKVLI